MRIKTVSLKEVSIHFLSKRQHAYDSFYSTANKYNIRKIHGDVFFPTIPSFLFSLVYKKNNKTNKNGMIYRIHSIMIATFVYLSMPGSSPKGMYTRGELLSRVYTASLAMYSFLQLALCTQEHKGRSLIFAIIQTTIGLISSLILRLQL